MLTGFLDKIRKGQQIIAPTPRPQSAVRRPTRSMRSAAAAATTVAVTTNGGGDAGGNDNVKVDLPGAVATVPTVAAASTPQQGAISPAEEAEEFDTGKRIDR